MTEGRLNQLFATDREIYDLIMSSPKRMSEGVILELISDRRIFASFSESRKDLAGFIASLQHDYYDVAGLIQKGEHGRRGERTTSIEIDTELTGAEVKDAVASYQKEVGTVENIVMAPNAGARMRVNVEYEEIDYSRTRLIQRQRRQADIEFTVADGKTLIRFPATEKAREVVESLKDAVESSRKSTFAKEEISLGSLNSPALRNDFFMSLIRSFNGYRLRYVSDAKVARWEDKDTDSEAQAGEEEKNESTRDIVSVVNSVTMRGVNIVLTPEYRRLLEQGFFLTAITWRAEQESSPRDLVQFEVIFDDGVAGTGFRYSVRHAPLRSSGRHATTFQAVQDTRRPALFQLIEDGARSVLKRLISSSETSEAPSAVGAK